MKRFKLVVPSFVALIFCMLLIAGSTFALFTSEAKANISVTSGKVKIEAGLDELKLYSANAVELATYNAAEANDKAGQITAGNYAGNYLFALQSEKFANGGTATLEADGGSLAVEKMTPGDKVVAKLAIDNQSNVNIKYRVVMTTSYTFGTGENEHTYPQTLASALKVTIGETQKQGLVSYQSAWIELENGADPASSLDFVLEFPLDAGNDYQEGGVKYNFVVEAVQANAATSGSELFDTIDLYVPARSAKETANDSEEATILAVKDNENDTKNRVTVTVPKNVATEGDTIELNVSDIFVEKSESTADSKVSMTIDLKINDVKVDENNPLGENKTVTVEIFVGTGLSDVELYHNGQLVDASYNESTGIITYTASHFSPFEIKGNFAAAVTIGSNAPVLYPSFDKALKAAHDAVTTEALVIDVFKDQTFSAPTMISKSITINGNNHKFTYNATRGVRVDTSEISLTLNNLTIVGSSNFERGVQVDSNKLNVTINLNDVTVTGVTYYAINLCVGTTVFMNINNSYISGWAAINAYGSGNIITVNNSTLEGINPYSGTSNSFCTICLEGDTTLHTDDHSSDYIITLTNCKIIAKSTGDQYQCVLGFNNNAINSLVNFVNCSFTLGETKCLFGYDISGTETNSILFDNEAVEYPRGVYFNFSFEE